MKTLQRYSGYFLNDFDMLPQMGTCIADGIHEGVIDYTAENVQVVHHNSKQFGRAVTTTIDAFGDGCSPVEVKYAPQNDLDAERVVLSAREDVRVGKLWLPADNCQDLVSRAITGHGGSATRNGIGLLLVLGLVAALLS